MGKSKTGGTRGYIRGRIANDVYSIGKDGMGKKQQVIRSLAESVANPRTTAQMRGRMIMSTIMQAVSALQPIIDHSFDGVAVGQPSISEFIRRNYALVKADVAAHPSAGNQFGLVKYGDKGIHYGAYILSDGKAANVSSVSYNSVYGGLQIDGLAEGATVGDLKEYLGITSDDFFTLVWITSGYSAKYMRFQINPGLADNTVISSDNIDSLFVMNGNVSAPTPTIATGTITINFNTSLKASGIITSRKVEGGYAHTNTSIEFWDTLTKDFTADVALPTYPTGSEQYLNGGEI